MEQQDLALIIILIVYMIWGLKIFDKEEPLV